MKPIIYFSALLAVFAASGASAAVTGKSQDGDKRIQVAIYSPNEVYNVYTVVGRASLIQFEEDESPDDTARGLVGLGDSQAWSVGIKANNMAIKPIANNPDTNVVVTTNKRTYVFALLTARRQTPTYILRFRYPETEAQIMAEKEKKEREAAELRKELESAPKRVNENYTMAGDIKIGPTAAWDDGQFTTFQYLDSRELPAIFKRAADGMESLVNYHIDRDRVVIHEINDVFILRLGELVVAVYNESYDSYGQFNYRNTSRGNVVRKEKRRAK